MEAESEKNPLYVGFSDVIHFLYTSWDAKGIVWLKVTKVVYNKLDRQLGSLGQEWGYS